MHGDRLLCARKDRGKNRGTVGRQQSFPALPLKQWSGAWTSAPASSVLAPLACRTVERGVPAACPVALSVFGRKVVSRSRGRSENSSLSFNPVVFTSAPYLSSYLLFLASSLLLPPSSTRHVYCTSRAPQFINGPSSGR
jgi:hypothetical protein